MAFTKRVYTSKNKIFLYGSGTLLAFLTLLVSLSYYGVNVTTSGDITCGSTCVSYFNISLTNYSLCMGSTFKGLVFDKDIIYELYKADLRYSRSNEARWKLYNLTAGVCLNKGSKYEFKIVGHKNPSDTIKWGINTQGQDVDPYWYGETNQKTITLNARNPMPSIYSIRVENCQVIFNGSSWEIGFKPYFRFNNGNLYACEDIPSSIKTKLWKIEDEYYYKYGVDFSNISNSIKNNLQNVILHRSYVFGLTNEDVGISGNSVFIKGIEISHQDILNTYSIPIINKTDVVIGNLGNSWIVCDNENCSINHTENNWKSNGDGTWNITFDPTISLINGNLTDDIVVRGAGVPPLKAGSQFKWDITPIPASSTIDDGLLCMTITDVDITGGNPTAVANVSYINNQTWNEANTAAQLEAMSELNSSIAYSLSSRARGWSCLNVTLFLRQSYANANSNFTIRFYSNTYPIATVGTTSNDATLKFGMLAEPNSITFNSSEAKSLTPYLNITYTLSDTVAPNISFVNPTRADNNITTDTAVPINISITESSLNSFIYNWNETNFTFYDKNLVGMYNLDTYNRVNDSSIYSNNGTLTGALFTSSGKYGGGYSFNGTNDYITVTGLNNYLNSTGTISAWAYPIGSVVNSYVFFSAGTLNNRYYIQWASGDFNVIRGGNPSTNIKVLDNAVLSNWYYITLTWNSTNMTGYLNGQFIGMKGYNYTATFGGGSLIGASNSSGTTFNGTIDEVFIYNRTLNNSEVYQLYASNFYKYGANKWALYVNQSQNATSLLNNGTYTYQAFATDGSGNSNQTDLRTIFIRGTDLTPPVFSNIQTNKSYAVVNENINFTATVTNSFLVDRSWLSHAFDLTDKSNVKQITSDRYAYYFGNIRHYGESFRFNQTLYLRNICFRISHYSGTKGDVYISLYRVSGNTPTGSNITSKAIINKDIINSTVQFICVNFTTPYQLTANTYYAVVASSPNSSTDLVYGMRCGSNVYEGRYVYSLDNGASWRSSTEDLIFNFTGSLYDWRNESRQQINSIQGNISQVKKLLWANHPLFLPNGFSYKWCGNDSSSNENCSSIYYFSVRENETITPDIIQPNGSIVSPPNNTKVNGNVTLDSIASDNIGGSGINYVSFQYTNSTTTAWTNITGCNQINNPNYDCTWNTALYSNDTLGYDLMIVPCDVAGNCNITTITKHYVIDRKIPWDGVFITYPTGQSSIRNTQTLIIKINLTDGSGAGMNTSGVFTDTTLLNETIKNSSMSLEVGTGATNTWSLFNISVTLANSITGLPTYISYYAYDNATPTNNLLWSTFPVKIDNDIPTYDNLTLGKVEPDPIYNNTEVSFQVNAFDNWNLSQYIFANNFSNAWVNITANFTGGSETDDWATNTSIMYTGNYSYYFIIYDDAGNSNTTELRDIQVLNPSPPEIVVNLILPEDGFNSTTMNVSFSYNYTNGTAQACDLLIDSEFNATTFEPAENTTQNFTANFSNGEYSWQIKCNNSDGNNYYSENRFFNVSFVFYSFFNITEILTPEGITSNSTIETEYNISTNQGLSQVKRSWDNINYSFYDSSLVFFYNFDNRSALGENDTFVSDLGPYNKFNLTTVGNTSIWDASYGKYNGAFLFNGTQPSTTYWIDPIFNSSLDYTFCFWIKAYEEYTDSYQYVFDRRASANRNNQISAVIYNHSTLRFEHWKEDGSTVGPNSYSSFTQNGEYMHVCHVIENSTYFYVYDNGVLKDYDISTTFNATNTTGRFIISMDFNGSLDDFMMWNRSLSALEAKQIYQLGLTKHNSTDWNFYTNQSLVLNSSVLNASNPSYNFNYYLCGSNSSGAEICSPQRNITKIIQTETLTANFTTSVGNVRNDFYGVGLQSSKMFSGSIDTNCDGTSETPRNYTWQKDTFLNGGNKITYYDASLGTYYSGIYNLDFEQWYNNSLYRNGTSGYVEMASGWYGGTETGINGTIYQTTDAHSGNFAIQLNASQFDNGVATIKRGDGIGEIKYKNNSFYNITYWAKGQGALNPNIQRKSGSYPDCSGINSFNLTDTWTKYSVTCNFTGSNLSQVSTIGYDNIPSSSVGYRLTLDCSGNCTLDDFNISEDETDMTNFWWRTGNLTAMKSQLGWDYENNITDMLIISYMPKFLANRSTNSSGWSLCLDNQTDTDDGDCMTNNLDIFSNISLDYYKTVDQYRNRSYVEIWNEPYWSFFEDNLAGNSAKIHFVSLYNVTYTIFKNYNSNIKVVGYRDTSLDYMGGTITAFTTMMLSNLSNELNDGFSFHPYYSYGYINGVHKIDQAMTDLFNNFTYYGMNVSYLLVDEWQPNYATRNESYASMPRYYAEIAYFYLSILNRYPANVSSMYYHWDDSVSYFNCPSRYSEYPAFWSGVSEKGLDNESYPSYYPTYNVTENLAILCPPGSTIYTSSSSSNTFKLVSCKKGNMRSIVIINTGATSINESINLTNSGITTLTNYENTSQTFAASGDTQLGVIDSYDILYLTEDLQPPSVTIKSPSNTSYDTFDIGFNVTLDEEGDTCIYTLDDWTTNNTLAKQGTITQFKATNNTMSEGGHTARFWCNDTFNNVNDTESINFVVHTIIPSIYFVTPTPTNNTIMKNNTAIISVNVSDTNLDQIKFNWNGTNYSLYDDSVVFMNSFENRSDLGESLVHLVDYSRYGNNASIINSLVWNATGGRGSGGYDFLGFNITSGSPRMIRAYPNRFLFPVTEGTNLTINSNFTISFWAKGYNTYHADTNIMFATFGYSAWFRWYDGATTASVNFNNKTWNGTAWKTSDSGLSAPFTQGRWYHLVVVRNGTNYTMYSNGVLSQSRMIAGSLQASGNRSMTIGGDIGYPNLNYLAWNGSIDDVVVWNRSLSTQEISQVYYATFNKYSTTDWNLAMNETLTNSEYTYFACASDILNSENCTETRTLTIDTVPPTITIVSPQAITYTTNNITFNVSISENGTCNHIMNETKYGLVSIWNFENGARDKFGVNHGTLVNNPTQTLGKFNQGYLLNGIDQYINFGTATTISNLADNFSINIWFNATSCQVVDNRYIFSRSNGYAFRICRGGTPDFGFIVYKNSTTEDSSYNSGLKLNNTEWQMGTLVFASKRTLFYLNGTLLRNQSFTTMGIGGNTIAGAWTTSYGYFNGTIDEAQIYNRVLSEDEIDEIYAAQITAMTRLNDTYSNYSRFNIGEGSHSVIYTCNDTLGNWESVSRYFAVDTVPPMITLNFPLTHEYLNYKNNITMNYTPSPDGGNISTCQIWGDWIGTWHKNQSKSVSDNSMNNIVNTFNVSFSDGTYLWNIWCNETTGFGDWSNQGNQTFTIDTTYPLVSITYPLNQTYTSSISELNYTLTEIYPEFCWYSIDLGATNSSPVSAGENFTSMVSSEGGNTWRVYCNDTAGNENFSSRTFVVSTAEFELNIDSPLNQTYDVSSIDFNISVKVGSGNFNLSFCQFTINNWFTNYTMTISEDLQKANYTNSSIANGGYRANFWCNSTEDIINDDEYVDFVIYDCSNCDGTKNCIIQCSDNCILLSEINMNWYNLTLNGSGYLKLNASFYNIGKWDFQHSTSERCQVILSNNTRFG